MLFILKKIDFCFLITKTNRPNIMCSGCPSVILGKPGVQPVRMLGLGTAQTGHNQYVEMTSNHQRTVLTFLI